MVRKNSRVVAILGLPICNVSMKQAIASIDGRIRSGCCYQIATANLDFVRNARRDPELHKVICDCAMVLPDGYPLVLVSRLLGRPLQGRLTGADLTPELAKLSAAKGYRIFLLGSSEENARKATEILLEQHPGAQFVGQYSPPPAPLAEMDNEEIVRRVHEARPDILLVAFGNPKQELWIHRNRERLQVPVSIGIGGTLEMIAGAKRRAPVLMRQLGMEWVWRMLQEPKRLAPRYFHDLVALARYLPVEMFASWAQSSRRSSGSLRIGQHEGHCVIAVQNALTDELCGRLRDLVSDAIAANQDVTIDLSGATRIGADGVGTLLDIRRSLMSHDLKLYLLGGNDSIQRLLNAGSLGFMFPNDTIVARTRFRLPLMAAALRAPRV
jgi:N-acetylglucosaminyldiphosphoundecaprenol N-acetyl-beta-D-mannosaminyltransferase